LFLNSRAADFENKYLAFEQHGGIRPAHPSLQCMDLSRDTELLTEGKLMLSATIVSECGPDFRVVGLALAANYTRLASGAVAVQVM
jgi:hypothetical protein